MPKAQYVITLIAQVSWEGRSNGLPSELLAFLLYEGSDRKVVNDLIEGQCGNFVRMQAFACQQDQGQVIDLRTTPQERMLVPMKWIVKITADVQLLGAEMTQPDEEGVERLSNGEEPLKN